ncbi:GlxA family transcriptional regulator [Pseudoalteromonas rubra]|uniref:HTH araC/xylS-type domain-containing protein n=1 Tax=Pseudoalteromonas rubra TaxID=43658 RepID=A0A5S3X4G3_9GAMM|nr:helix-turn-helix domain-containing protein [Pseudoalteromonas rubra]TMP38750.1 hypothetical protein CWB98_06245 [Pseudoalteromonas rubra]
MDKITSCSDVSQRTIQIAFFMPEQYWSGSIALIVDVFTGINMLREQAGHYDTPTYNTHFLHEPDMYPKGLSPCQFPLRPLDAEHYDVVVIPAIWSITPKALAQYSQVFDWLRHQQRSGAHFVSITSGAFFLAEAGVLFGEDITLHFAFQSLFRSLYPGNRVRTDKQYLTSGKVWSSAGLSPTFEVIYQLVRKYSGEALAQVCARYFMLDYHVQPPVEVADANSRDMLISAVRDWLERHYYQAPTNQDIARQFHMSARNLNRRFASETGLTPQGYLQNLRLERAAKLLVSTKIQVEHIALQCGYSCASVLGKRFKKQYGRSPLAYRNYMSRHRGSD